MYIQIGCLFNYADSKEVKENDSIKLVPEPENIYDEFAVSALYKIKGKYRQIGYVSRCESVRVDRKLIPIKGVRARVIKRVTPERDGNDMLVVYIKT